jgi:hypothetical protein
VGSRAPPGGCIVVAALTGADAPAALQVVAHATAVPSTAVAAQTSANVPTARLMEIAVFIGGADLPPRTGTMVTMGSRPLLGTLVPAAGILPSPKSTTSSGAR